MPKKWQPLKGGATQTDEIPAQATSFLLDAAPVRVCCARGGYGYHVPQQRRRPDRRQSGQHRAVVRRVAARYARSLPASAPGEPQLDLLQVLLQLVLIEAPHVEGGVWHATGGMLAYAYPTYEGSGVKRDVPAAEQPLIIELAQLAARTQQAQTDWAGASTTAGSAAAALFACQSLQLDADRTIVEQAQRAPRALLELCGSTYSSGNPQGNAAPPKS
jgi:hypothetical protein